MDARLHHTVRHPALQCCAITNMEQHVKSQVGRRRLLYQRTHQNAALNEASWLQVHPAHHQHIHRQRHLVLAGCHQCGVAIQHLQGLA